MITLKYLNKEQKNTVIMLGMMLDVLDKVIRVLKIDGNERGRLRASRTNIKVVFERLVQSLEPKHQQALLRASKHNRFTVVADTERLYEEDYIDEAHEKMDTLAAYAMGSACKNCTKKGDDVEGCELREALLAYNIPLWDEECEHSECPYCWLWREQDDKSK